MVFSKLTNIRNRCLIKTKNFDSPAKATEPTLHAEAYDSEYYYLAPTIEISMNKFNKIASADHPGLVDWAYPELQQMAKSPIARISTYPENNDEIIANIGDADCALVSWNTVIDKSVIDACPKLKYIGMCCSLIDESSANVDIAAARAKGIVVKGVRDFGDEGVIEFIVSELIQLFKGLGKYQWKADQVELGGQKLGIIGMGTTGKILAEAASF
jgi:lactate dehydrogenase-like 2-hydroxyacid dehydrogenase